MHTAQATAVGASGMVATGYHMAGSEADTPGVGMEATGASVGRRLGG